METYQNKKKWIWEDDIDILQLDRLLNEALQNQMLR